MKSKVIMNIDEYLRFYKPCEPEWTPEKYPVVVVFFPSCKTEEWVYLEDFNCDKDSRY